MAEGTGAPRDDARAAIDDFNKAVRALTEIAQQLRSAAPSSGHRESPSVSPPTEEEKEGLDAAFRYRLLRSLMTGVEAPGILAGVGRRLDDGNLPVGLTVALPQGVTATQLSLVGDVLGPSNHPTGERAPREFALDGTEIPRSVLDTAKIDIDGLLDDIRLFEAPGAPVLAVAPALPPWSPDEGTSSQTVASRQPAS